LPIKEKRGGKIMSRRVKKFTAEFKFHVVLECIKKGNVAEVARHYGIHPNKLSTWKSDFMKNGPDVFEQSRDKVAEQLKKQIKGLENLLGKKEIEINLLKGYLDFYVPPDLR
jgi:transposase-like protein